jgi:hypothetical protein
MFDVFYIGNKPCLFAHERAVESIEQAQQLSRTRFFWMINYLADYTGFDFLWEPVPWQAHQRHAWASQWQKDSGTYLVPKQGYTDTNYHPEVIIMTPDMKLWKNINTVDTFDFSWHPDYTDPVFNYEFGTQWQKTGGPVYPMIGATETKYVSQSGSRVRAMAQHAYVIDHMDGHTVTIPVNVAKTVRYFDNYKDTLTRIANTCDHEFVWIISSLCDYTNFDFSWHPEAWQNHMLHVFASNGEKFGDTFFMHVPTFRAKIKEFELLDWYDLNFVNISVSRHHMPVITHNYDTQVQAIKNTEWKGPVAVFVSDNTTVDCSTLPTVSLWREKTKTVIPLNASASILIVPKNTVPYVKTQLYDYPYIDRTHRKDFSSQLQDIVFISYDEPEADHNWSVLHTRFPQSKRVHGVAGMERALEAAADVSTTPWYYAVFAKTKLHETFDFSYVPDYMQQPKHYIFNALNTVNGLEYGHMGIVMYNCNGVREQNRRADFGIDYTLSFPHESIPLLSCYGSFDQTPYHTWRTAFRESAKLAYFEHLQPTVEGAYRLNVWLTVANGQYAEWSMRGAEDGVEFFEQSGRELDILKQSFKWEWLRSYFVKKYGELQ